MNFVIILILLAISPLSMAQFCNSGVVSEDPSVRFITNDDGTVLDVTTMTTWSRCSLGQTYTDEGCSGSVEVYETWYDALQAASQVDGMRLPSIKELASIVDRRCVEPAINLDLFPETPLHVYWSSTPDDSGSAWIVDFNDGSEIVRDLNRPTSVRLVVE